MNRAIAMLIIGLVFGGGLGFVLAAANGVTLDGHDHSTDHVPGAGTFDPAAHAGHETPLNLTAEAAPSLEIEAFADPVVGWNLNIRTTNFQCAPEQAGLDHIEGEGHAHIYANGVKLGRVYGEWYHLEGLPSGSRIAVTLNANDHSPLAVDGEPIRAELTLEGMSGG